MIQENDLKYNWTLENSSKDILSTYNAKCSHSVNGDKVFKKDDSIGSITSIVKDNNQETRYILKDKGFVIVHNWSDDTIKIFSLSDYYLGYAMYCSLVVDFLKKDFNEIVRGY